MTRYLPKRKIPPLALDVEENSDHNPVITTPSPAAVPTATPFADSSRYGSYRENLSVKFDKFKPKRVNELPPLQPESDDEDENKLNCNLLNNSSFNNLFENELDQDDETVNVEKENDINKGNLIQPAAADQEKHDSSLTSQMKGLKPFESIPKIIVSEPKPPIPLDLVAPPKYRPMKAFHPATNPTKSLRVPMPGLSIFNSLKKNVPAEHRPDVRFDGATKSNSESLSVKKLSTSRSFDIKCTAGYKPLSPGGCDAPGKVQRISADGKLESQNKPLISFVESRSATSSINDKFQTPHPQLKKMPTVSSSFQPPKLGDSSARINGTSIAIPYPQSVITAPTKNDSIGLTLDDTTQLGTAAKPLCEDFRTSTDDLLSFDANSIFDVATSKRKTRTVVHGVAYILDKKIGSGASSSVFLAYREKDRQQYAVKVVDLRGDSAVVQGYINETKLLAKLQGNENVIKLLEYSHTDTILYMVMEKGDSDLHHILQSYTSELPLFRLMQFWYEMLQAVHYIHQNGVIHSDLKPANFLMVNGRLKLIDFGIASNISTDSTSIIKHSQAGTFNYISPEALIDTSTGDSPPSKSQPKIKISTKSDVWSLGCILYYLLYKKTPFADIKNLYAKIHAITNPSTQIDYPALPNYYPPILIEMLKRCLQHNPKSRSAVAELLAHPFNMVFPVRNCTCTQHGT